MSAKPHRFVALLLLAAMIHALSGPAIAQFADWKQSGSLFILTTPDGADLPAAASIEGFPLLIRLNKESFDFAKAQSHGEDLRFATRDSIPLPYQIEEWDPAGGKATVWVRMPKIGGNARQELRVYWGNANAKSESSGKGVFNESNGYLSVWHLGDTVDDEVGSLPSKDVGTEVVSGIIGQARHLAGKQGLSCGESISNYPTGANDHTTEAWFRAEKTNGRVIAWGNEQSQGKVVMHYRSPPHVKMDCYFSGADVETRNAIPLSKWAHVVHTYHRGESRVYVNGVLDGETKTASAPLNIKSPARLWIGGWYNNYDFIGDIDEVRVSSVTRSAEWIKLQYENQKPMQTLLGLLVKEGSTFSVSDSKIILPEGRSQTLTVQADGAQKLYWILKRDGVDSIVAVDQYSYTLDAGRVVADTSFGLQCKAVYANQIRTADIAVTVKEEIPEPDFTLDAPTKWNGRDTIEVVPRISNLAAMQSQGAGELHYVWSVSGGAVIKQVEPDRLVLKRSQYSGPITVTVAIDNRGSPTTAAREILVTEPKTDPWVQRTPGKDEKPVDNQFYARDDKNLGTLHYNGTLDQPADSVFLKVYADDKLFATESRTFKTENRKLGTDKDYAFTVKLKPGLIKYNVEFGTKTGDVERVVQIVTNLVCGDAYIIQGQSNALATDTGEKSPPETNAWIRSYGRPESNPKGMANNLWCNPVWKAQKGDKAELGWWGMELAKRLVESQKMPIFIINGAVGGTRIDQHQRNETDPTDLTTIYGRMLWRVQQARLTHGIRGTLWHQGENDQGADGPDGGYGSETYQKYFVEMSAAWKQDFPNIQHYYLFQIWPNSCSMGNGHGDMLREMQRKLPSLYSNMDIMSTLGVKPPGGCHFPLIGWAEFARLIQPLIERDHYGARNTEFITAPNLQRAYYTSPAKDAIALEFDQPIDWADTLAGQFYLDGEKDKVVSGSLNGNVLTFTLKEASAAKHITYLKEKSWSQEKLMVGKNGIAALTFCEVPIGVK